MRLTDQHNIRISGSRHHHRPRRLHKSQQRNANTFWKLAGLFLLTGFLTNIPAIHLHNLLGFENSWWLDMLQHVGYYFLLTVCLFFVLPSQKRTFYFFLIVFGVSVLFEITQVFLYKIGLSRKDIVSNFLGISLAFLWYRFVGYMKYRYAKGY
ncbi:MAG TPA: hypothetical protein VLJ68_01510 [Chitinophagaceae bacterium]|nr:hypothetical protein [Chitinophagaceae bacterium]